MPPDFTLLRQGAHFFQLWPLSHPMIEATSATPSCSTLPISTSAFVHLPSPLTTYARPINVIRHCVALPIGAPSRSHNFTDHSSLRNSCSNPRQKSALKAHRFRCSHRVSQDSLVERTSQQTHGPHRRLQSCISLHDSCGIPLLPQLPAGAAVPDPQRDRCMAHCVIVRR